MTLSKPSAFENEGTLEVRLRYTSLITRYIKVMGARTSIRLEPQMLDGLLEISEREGVSINVLCSWVAKRKADELSLTAAIRVFVMEYYREAATEEGHALAGHKGAARFKSRLVGGW